jgi:hypothetical protein
MVSLSNHRMGRTAVPTVLAKTLCGESLGMNTVGPGLRSGRQMLRDEKDSLRRE